MSHPSRPVRRSQDAGFALRATARPQRDGGTKEERDDRSLRTFAGLRATKADGRVFLQPSPALRTGLLPYGPSLLRPCRSSNLNGGPQATADKPGTSTYRTILRP